MAAHLPSFGVARAETALFSGERIPIGKTGTRVSEVFVPNNNLKVSFIGEVRLLAEGDQLSFGRSADLVIDEQNQYLHRVLGRFSDVEGVWWLENLGSHIELELVADPGTVVSLPPCPPGGAPPLVPLPGGPSLLSFEVAGSRYELEVEAPQRVGGPSIAGPDDEAASETLGYGRIQLTDEERALLVQLAEPLLRDRGVGAESLPTNKRIAHDLGWSITKFNRKLDYLCVRLTKAGVKGLQGGAGVQATNRRWRLVEHSVAARLVTADELV